MTTKLHKHLIKDTGIEILIKKVSPLLMREFQSNFQEPKPPTQEVIIGDPNAKSPVVELQENPTHPEYVKALQEHNDNYEKKFQEFLINRGIVIELTEEQKQEIKDLRKDWMEEYGKELPGNDKYAYITNIAIGTKEDYQELIYAVWSRTMPTPEEIEASMKSFQGDVPK